MATPSASASAPPAPAPHAGEVHPDADELPSCLGRRMADTALHLVNKVIPEVPVRQWVCSLPRPRTASRRLASATRAPHASTTSTIVSWRTA